MEIEAAWKKHREEHEDSYGDVSDPEHLFDMSVQRRVHLENQVNAYNAAHPDAPIEVAGLSPAP